MIGLVASLFRTMDKTEEKKGFVSKKGKPYVTPVLCANGQMTSLTPSKSVISETKQQSFNENTPPALKKELKKNSQTARYVHGLVRDTQSKEDEERGVTLVPAHGGEDEEGGSVIAHENGGEGDTQSKEDEERDVTLVPAHGGEDEEGGSVIAHSKEDGEDEKGGGVRDEERGGGVTLVPAHVAETSLAVETLIQIKDLLVVVLQSMSRIECRLIATMPCTDEISTSSRKRPLENTDNDPKDSQRKRKRLSETDDDSDDSRKMCLALLQRYHKACHFVPASYCSRIKKKDCNAVMHCFDCNSEFKSPMGFQKHVYAENHFYVPVEYSEFYPLETENNDDESSTDENTVCIAVGKKVELYQNEKVVAEGKVVALPPCCVHNHLILPTEIKVQVTTVHAPAAHSRHGYDMEEGSFAAWNIKDIAVIC